MLQSATIVWVAWYVTGLGTWHLPLLVPRMFVCILVYAIAEHIVGPRWLDYLWKNACFDVLVLQLLSCISSTLKITVRLHVSK